MTFIPHRTPAKHPHQGNRKILAHVWLAAAILSAVIVVGIAGLWAHIGGPLAEIRAKDVPLSNGIALEVYGRGLELLDQKKLEPALARFRAARQASAPELLAAAIAAESRAENALKLPPWLQPAALWFADVPPSMRLVAAGVFALAGLLCLGQWLQGCSLRPGCDVGDVLVSGVGAGINASIPRELLRDELERIGFRLQHTADLGAALPVETLLPGAESSLGVALKEMKELSAQGGALFVLSQAGRAMSLLRRPRRYRVTGSVSLYAGLASAAATLTDLQEGRVIARLAVSTTEATFPDAVPTRGASRPASLMAAVVQVLAFKIWHQLSLGAREAFRPNSWLTLATMVSGLEALAADQTGSADGTWPARAERAFSRIVDDLDPLYTPARFFRGYARLLVGDLDGCATDMKTITDGAEREFGVFLKRILTNFSKIEIKWWIRFLRPVRPLFSHISAIFDGLKWIDDRFIEIYGGSAYIAAKAWDDVKADPENKAKFRHLKMAMSMLANAKTYEAAHDIITGTQRFESMRVKDKEIIDQKLNVGSIKNIDNSLKRLDIMLVGSLGRMRISEIANRPKPLSDVTLDRNDNDADRTKIIKHLEANGLSDFYDLIAQSKYDDARTLVREIRRLTHIPDEAGAVINICWTPIPNTWVTRLALPGIKIISQLKMMIISDRMYGQALCYSCKAKYESRIFQNISDIHKTYMSKYSRFFISDDVTVDELDDRAREASILIRCLVICAQARISAMDVTFEEREEFLARNNRPKKRITQVFAQRTSIDELEVARREMRFIGLEHRRYMTLMNEYLQQPETSRAEAACLATKALLEWFGKRHDKITDNDDIRDDPITLLQQAVGLEPSGARYAEVAEFLVYAGRREEATRLFRLAHTLSPRHPLPRRWLDGEKQSP